MKIKTVLALVAALSGLMAASVPAQADSHWEHRPSHREADVRHKYVYYPARQVYYAPDSRSWFWMNGGSWQVGASLPGSIRIEPTNGVQIVLSSGHPYTQHVYVEENYGRPWRAKHRMHERERHYHRHDGHHRHDKHHHGHSKHHKHDKHGHGHRHGRDRDDDDD
jgi:hypothetical protein